VTDEDAQRLYRIEEKLDALAVHVEELDRDARRSIRSITEFLQVLARHPLVSKFLR
jgi:hypothetical protein